MATQIKLKRDTSANWASINPVLAPGEPGYELDTAKLKIGDGTTAYNSLPFSAITLAELSNLTVDVETTGNITAATFFGDGGNLSNIDVDLTASTTDDLAEGIVNLYYTDTRVNDLLSAGAGTASFTANVTVADTLKSKVVKANTTQDGGFVISGGNQPTAPSDVLLRNNNGSLSTNSAGLLLNTDSNVGVDGGIILARGALSASVEWNENLSQWRFSEDGNVFFPLARTTNDLSEGNTNLYYTDQRVDDFISANITTDDITEGNTSLYYTDQRVKDVLTAGVEGATFGNSVVIQGDLEVQGNVSQVSVVDLQVQDHEITLNFGNASARDAFVTVDRSGSSIPNVSIKWNQNNALWEFTNDGANFRPIPISTTTLLEGTNLYFTQARARESVSASGDLEYNSTTGVFSVTTYKTADFNTDFGTKTTNDLAEGNVNLYFTATRSRNSVSASGDLSYDNETGVFSVTTYKSTDFDADFGGKDTDDLTEGNVNLYYTDTRANAAIAAYDGDIDTTGNISAGIVQAETVELKQFAETVVDAGNISGNVTFDFALGTVHTATITGNVDSVTLANALPGSSGTLILTQDGGPFEFEGGNNWVYAGGDGDISATANAVDIISVISTANVVFAAITRGYE